MQKTNQPASGGWSRKFFGQRRDASKGHESSGTADFVKPLAGLSFEPDKKFARPAAVPQRPAAGAGRSVDGAQASGRPAGGRQAGQNRREQKPGQRGQVRPRPEGEPKGERRPGGVKRPARRGRGRNELPPLPKMERGVTDLGPADGKLRIIPVGGQEEVGRNMTIFEYGEDIVIIDMGLQFPEEDMPGIDYIVPNANYLKGKEHRIRGIIFTHGHLDHIGAAPILLKQLHYPPVIGKDFTLALIKHKVEDQEKGAASRLKTIRIKDFTDRIKLGVFEASFFEVEHSIMDAVGTVLTSPSGSVIHMGDWTISNEPIDPHPISYTHLRDLPRPTVLMLESLGALKKGLPPSEQEVHRNFQNLLKDAPGRIIIGTFASQVRRIGYIMEYAEALGKKVALEGYSMKMNVEVAKELGYLKVKKETIIPINEIDRYPNNRVVIICTGAQGEANAALSRIVTDNHRFVKLQKNDTIIFSSSVIPGNERTIQRLKDNLYRKCENVIHSDIMEVHIGGHSTSEGIKEMLHQVKPNFFMPVYANHYFLKEAGKVAKSIGFPEQDIFVLDNGGVLEIENNMARQRKEKVDSSYVFIDGLGIGDIGHVVLRDRQMLAQDGMVVVTAIIDSKSKKPVGAIQITSRGFIHVKENFELVNDIKKKVQDVIRKNTSKEASLDWDLVRNQIRDQVGQFIFSKTERRPMVLPVVMEV